MMIILFILRRCDKPCRAQVFACEASTTTAAAAVGVATKGRWQLRTAQSTIGGRRRSALTPNWMQTSVSVGTHPAGDMQALILLGICRHSSCWGYAGLYSFIVENLQQSKCMH